MGQHESSARQGKMLDTRNETDMLVHSESPQIQEFRLYRELSREIQKNPSDRSRYIDSEIYSRNQDGHSEIQSATVNIGLNQQSSATSSSSSNCKDASSSTTKSSPKNSKNHQNNHHNQAIVAGSELDDQRHQADRGSESMSAREAKNHATMFLDGNCQVCLIKELRDDLTHVTRVIEERNEQLSSKLKAKRLRTFFERQMNDGMK